MVDTTSGGSPPGNDEGAAVIADVLSVSSPRPQGSDSASVKNQYAVRFADRMATRLAEDLATRLEGITAATKRSAVSVRGHKQLDVNFSTPQHGLALGISLKSVHLRDMKSGRYTHNMKRNEEELRIEASGYHKRQPYAVMIGVLFLPFDSCDDSKGEHPSSFGSWMRHLRPYCSRLEPDDEIDRFEKLYIALYEPEGTDLRFFDVEADPPRNRRPPRDGDLLASDGRTRRLLTYSEFLDTVYHRFLQRNSAEFHWADGGEEPIAIHENEEDEQGDT